MTVNITLKSLKIILIRKAITWKRVPEARSTKKKAKRVEVLMTNRKLSSQMMKINAVMYLTREGLK